MCWSNRIDEHSTTFDQLIYSPLQKIASFIPARRTFTRNLACNSRGGRCHGNCAQAHVGSKTLNCITSEKKTKFLQKPLCYVSLNFVTSDNYICVCELKNCGVYIFLLIYIFRLICENSV